MARLPKVKRGKKPYGFPSKVTLFGVSIKIIYCTQMPKQDQDCMGLTYYTEKYIYINLEQTRAEMEQTLFHEFCHMLLFLSGHSFRLSEEDEEAVVRAMEHGVLQLYKRKRI